MITGAQTSRATSAPLTAAQEWPLQAQTHDGTEYRIRPLQADDLERNRAFLGSLSFSSRCHQMLTTLANLDDGLLDRVARLDYQREMTLVAVTGAGEAESIVAVARYGGNPIYCEFALAVADEWQCRGVGTTLSEALFTYAKNHGVRRVYGVVFEKNESMLKLASALRMTLRRSLSDLSLQEVWRTL
jgi:acetyltransferase